jgi:hypothetical protein
MLDVLGLMHRGEKRLSAALTDVVLHPTLHPVLSHLSLLLHHFLQQPLWGSVHSLLSDGSQLNFLFSVHVVEVAHEVEAKVKVEVKASRNLMSNS